MKFSQLKVEPHLTGAFLKYMKRQGYEAVVSCNPQQPFYLNHQSTPELSHIIEIDHLGKWVIPEQLHRLALMFLSEL